MCGGVPLFFFRFLPCEIVRASRTVPGDASAGAREKDKREICRQEMHAGVCRTFCSKKAFIKWFELLCALCGQFCQFVRFDGEIV